MAKFNPDEWDAQHLNNEQLYEKQIDAIYQTAIREAAAIGAIITTFNPDKPFSFADYPATKNRVDKLLKNLHSKIYAVILKGIDAEWTLSNNKNNELANIVFGDNVKNLSQEQERRYYRTNDSAKQSFIKRKESGLNLSDRVWNYTNLFRAEMEAGLDLGLRQGQSAAEMSRDLQQYLKYPDKLYRRVRDEHGVLQLSKAALDFHPGQGVYRSSYKNARRLAATETNIAYRTADFERWRQFDFVVGIEIKLSNNHTLNGESFTDICDTLAGLYPKDFKFTGWHPHCRCHAVPVLKTQEEIDADNEAMLNGGTPTVRSVNSIDKAPPQFDDWVEQNKERAKGWSSMPYFIKDNPHFVKGFEIDTYTKSERKFTRARRTNDAMKESLDTYMLAKYPNVANTEKAAIHHYTQGDRSAFRQLNNQLRRGNLSEFNEAFSELLSKGINKLPKSKGTVYRTVRLNRTSLRNWVDMAEQKATTVFDGFTSTSRDRSIVSGFLSKQRKPKKNETDVLLVIKSKSGRKIDDFSFYSGAESQKEVLFDKGKKFKIEKLSIEDDQRVFTLSEI